MPRKRLLFAHFFSLSSVESRSCFNTSVVKLLTLSLHFTLINNTTESWGCYRLKAMNTFQLILLSDFEIKWISLNPVSKKMKPLRKFWRSLWSSVHMMGLVRGLVMRGWYTESIQRQRHSLKERQCIICKVWVELWPSGCLLSVFPVFNPERHQQWRFSLLIQARQ